MLWGETEKVMEKQIERNRNLSTLYKSQYLDRWGHARGHSTHFLCKGSKTDKTTLCLCAYEFCPERFQHTFEWWMVDRQWK